jgi:CHAT domain-containing protein
VLGLLADAAYVLYAADPSDEHLELFRRLESDFVETAERTRMQFYDPYTKGLLNDRAEQFLRQTISRYFELYVQTSRPEFLERIYELSEYGKASAIRDQLRTGAGSFGGVPDSVPAELARYQQRIESLYYQLEDAPEGRRDSLDRALFRTRLAYDSLNLRVAADYPDYYALFGGQELGARTQVQSIAPNSNESHLIYLLGADGYYALIVHSGTMQAVFCGAREEVDGLIADWRADIASVLTDHHLASGNRLYRKLWAPVAAYLAGDRVRIIPDGAIHSVAFDALSASATEDRYLLYDYTISYAHSLTLYDRQSAQRLPGGEGGILSIAPGFGPESGSPSAVSQPFALGLARRLKNTYVGQALLGWEATETNVRSATDEGSVLLFATHGTVNREMPLQSGIQLTGVAEGGSDDGFWSIAEIFSSRLSADLSILGICESGIGRLTPGEGMLSVAYAFSYAGCASTVNTLWPVDDRANAELTEAFLSNLAEGTERSAALRDAKLGYLEHAGQELRHPYYWGALVIQGRDGPVDIRRKRKWQWWAIAIAISAVLAFAFTPSPARRRPRADKEPDLVE